MTGRIARDLVAAADRPHDLIVIGGGIYGVCVALEAALRGLRPALIERDDFGGATSGSSLRIVHGGLRYLQKMDLTRYHESVPERNWFGRVLPDLVRPLACLMPLYGDGLRKPAIFRTALAMNDWLSRRRNVGLREDARLGAGCVITPDDVAARYPGVRTAGLRGGAVWHDAYMQSSERVLIELLRWACLHGATALNYVQARGVMVEGGAVAGIEAEDRVGGTTLRLRAPRVVNCAGPWSREVSARLDRERPELMHPSMAFNLMLDRPALSSSAVAVSPPRKGSPTYFLLPWKGRVFAGTCHLPWADGLDGIGPTPQQIEAFVEDLNAAAPTLDASPDDVMRVYAGILPAVAEGSERTADRPVLIDHAAAGGPRGLVSVSGVKYTTARLVAEQTLRLTYGSELHGIDPARATPPDGVPERFLHLDEGPHDPETLRRMVEDEAVVHLDDLLLRRVDWTVRPDEALPLADRIAQALPWEDGRRVAECARLETILGGLAFVGLPRPFSPVPALQESHT